MYPSIIAKSECGRVRGPQWLEWLGHLRGTSAKGFEIGTFQGDSAEWMLDNIFTHPDSRYYCVDPFEPEGSADHVAHGVDCTKNEAIARAKLERFPNVTIRKEYSNWWMRRAPIGYFDFGYIDGDHSSFGTLRDAVMGWELLLSGGILVFDDYQWKEMPEELDRPKLAIDAFLRIYEPRQITILLEPTGWQIAVQKQ